MPARARQRPPLRSSQGDRWRNAESSTEAIVSSDDPRAQQRSRASRPGRAADYALSGNAVTVAALAEHQQCSRLESL